MAETVKKSRIVSDPDDNLEESLMEEFNLRLKSCMSKDDLNELHDYEDVEPTTNGHHVSNPSYDFLKNERENHYDVPRPLNNAQDIPAETENAEDQDEIYSEPTFTNGDEKPNIPSLSLPVTCFTDFSEPEPELQEVKSVKDRMFLATDDASCLLFTQTVTSPMLTPSEENIDFLKGFEATDSPQNLSTDASSPKSESEATNLDVTDDIPVVSHVKTVTNESFELKEHIYENIDELNSFDNEIYTSNEENAYENVEDLINSEEPQETVNDTTKIDSNECIVDDKIDSTPIKTPDPIVDQQEEPEWPGLPVVKALTSRFSKTETEETTKVTQQQNEEFTELKTLNLMKHISKFETKEETNIVSTESYQTSTYVETTMSGSLDGVEQESKMTVKKKKTKKARKDHEKENISVSDFNTNNQEFCYNVNVKNLCRSFCDLTGTEDEKAYINGQFKKTRTKSLSDMPAPNNIERVFDLVSVKTLKDVFTGKDSNNNNVGKSSFSKFDALQKKNVLHVRSSDSSKAQEKFSGAHVEDANCKACSKQVFQMEQIKAVGAIWHRNCFRCSDCNKQLNVDTYESHEGMLYCKPHFKALFAPKAVEDDTPQPKQNRHRMIICENEPMELPPDVVRASDKPDLGLEELQSLNVKERFQVFEHHEESDVSQLEKGPVNVKRSPSILSKLARFQAKGMDVGVADESLNGVPIEESSSEEEEPEDDGIEGEDADLIRAKRVQKEKPFHFTGMSDVKNKWEQGVEQSRDERREERKQEIQAIRTRLFMGKQGKMKEAYQQAILETESQTKKQTPIDVPAELCDTRSIKERFEKGELTSEERREKEQEDMSVFESGISKKSRSIFMELDANASKPPQLAPVSPSKSSSEVVRKTREVFMQREPAEEVVKSSEQVDEVTVRTADIQERFKFFETYKEPEKSRKEFRITPPREGQVKAPTPEREVERDPNVARAEEYIEDSVVARQTHTATKMLNKFREMEENLAKESAPQGPKPLKRFTPPPEPPRPETSSGEEEESGSEEEEDVNEEYTNNKLRDEDLIEAQKAARAKQLRAKFERWEANEIKKEQNGNVNIIEDIGDEQSQIETARSLRARFESMRETSGEQVRTTRVKVNRFVEITNVSETCEGCGARVYPLEKVTVHGRIFHRSCFKCMECSTILRMDSYSYNQGLLYCMPHFKRLFISKGNYDSGFGLEQHKEKWNATVA